jgi:hypothetical protein
MGVFVMAAYCGLVVPLLRSRARLLWLLLAGTVLAVLPGILCAADGSRAWMINVAAFTVVGVMAGLVKWALQAK